MSLGIASIWRIALQKAIITHNIHVSSYFSMRCHVLHRVSQEEKAFSGLTLSKHALLPALLRGARAVAPVDRNWPVEICATVLSPVALLEARPLTAPPAHSKH